MNCPVCGKPFVIHRISPVTFENHSACVSSMVSICNELQTAAWEVMHAMETHGPSIVPHLLDTDENAGQRLRDAIIKAREIQMRSLYAEISITLHRVGNEQPVEKSEVLKLFSRFENARGGI